MLCSVELYEGAEPIYREKEENLDLVNSLPSQYSQVIW